MNAMAGAANMKASNSGHLFFVTSESMRLHIGDTHDFLTGLRETRRGLVSKWGSNLPILRRTT